MATEQSAARRLTDAFLARDAPAMVAELAPDAVFHSPVADYEGRDRIGLVLTAVTQVVAAPQPTRLIEGSDETLLAFTAEVEGSAGDGVLLAIGERDGAISELTLMVRPLATLLDAVDRMKVLLGVAGPAQIAQDDLPGRFEGADHGSGVSFFLARTPPGRGPRLHRHPYEETFVVHEGRVELHGRRADDRGGGRSDRDRAARQRAQVRQRRQRSRPHDQHPPAPTNVPGGPGLTGGSEEFVEV